MLIVCRALVMSALLAASTFALAQYDAPERLRIHGSNILGERVIPDMVTAWLKQIGYSQIKRRDFGAVRTEISAVSDDGAGLVVEIDKHGTASGLADLIAGNAEISMSARPPNPRELDAAWQLGDLHSPDQEWVVALEGVAVVTAPDNPISSLSQSQLHDVVSGRIRDWRELGGEPGPIVLTTRPADTGAYELLSDLVLGGARVGAKTATYDSDIQIVAAVGNDRKALGIVGLRTPLDGVKPIALNLGAQQIDPDAVAVGSEDYPLVRRLYLHTGQLPTALGRGFAEYAISAAGQTVVERSGLISLELGTATAVLPRSASRDYAQIVGNARRLATSLHFSNGLDFLDSRARQDLERLANLLHPVGKVQRQVVLVGFAEPDPKTPYQSIWASNERVDSVSREMLKMGIHVVAARGLGGSKSLAATGQASARYRDERVEVWVR